MSFIDTNFLKKVPLFSGLRRDADLQKITKKLAHKACPRGTTLYQEGEEGDCLYIIKSGRVKILTKSPDGQERTLAYLGRPGEVFGEGSLLLGEPRSATVRADTACDLLVLTKKDFGALLEGNPSMSLHLSRMLSRRLALTSHERGTPTEPVLLSITGGACEGGGSDLALFAVNLAASLARQTKKKTMLLDLSDPPGQMARAVGLKPILSTPDMIQEEDIQEISVIERMALQHPSGFRLITLPPNVLEGRLFPAATALLSLLKSAYDFTLIVVPSEESPLTNRILMESDHALFLFSSEKASDGMRCLEKIRAGGGGGSLKAVWQKGEMDALTSTRDVEEAAGQTLFAALPHDPEAAAIFEKSRRPLAEVRRDLPLSLAIDRIARRFGHITVGVALGSGAAYGFSHIGVLKVFEESGIPVDMICGTSMGALIAAFYASGKKADEIAEIARKMEQRKNLFGKSGIFGFLDLAFPFRSGFFRGFHILRFLKEILGEKEFKDLEIPFACVSTDILTGQKVVMDAGKLYEAVRCSLSLPVVFNPVFREGKHLVDGGLVDPVPSDVLQRMGANILIAVNVTSKPELKRSGLRLQKSYLDRLGENLNPFRGPNMIDVATKMFYTMEYEIAKTRSEVAHVVISPDTRDFTWTDFTRAHEIIELGRQTAQASVLKIKSLLPEYADFCRIEAAKATSKTAF